MAGLGRSWNLADRSDSTLHYREEKIQEIYIGDSFNMPRVARYKNARLQGNFDFVCISTKKTML